MLNPRSRAIAISIVSTLVVAACATTKPVALWQDPSYTAGPVDNILIIGISDEEAIRRTFEDTFVSELQAKKVNAVASYQMMPSSEKISRESIESAIAGQKIDAVLITRLLGVEQRETYVPPSYLPTTMTGYGSYYGYYSRAYDQVYVYEPGYYAKFEVVKLESNLYETADAKLIWSMQTESLDPQSDKEVIQGQIKAVVQNLAESNLI